MAKMARSDWCDMWQKNVGQAQRSDIQNHHNKTKTPFIPLKLITHHDPTVKIKIQLPGLKPQAYNH